VESAVEALRQKTDLKSCRNGLKQLNTLFAREPDQRPPGLSDAERSLLATILGLDEGTLGEVGSVSFTLLDANYVVLCLLMRDAARSLDVADLDPRERAVAAFNWVTRQVALREVDQDPVPPDFTLYRGSGTSVERALTFLCLLQQLGIDGCMISCPSKGEDPSAMRYWSPGALVNNEILVFDTRLGLPLPAADPNHVATIGQLKRQPELLSCLNIDSTHHYDVSGEQIRRAEIRPLCLISAFAPRMRYLEGILAGTHKVRLATEPVALFERFRGAAKAADVKMQTDSGANTVSQLASSQRRFLPPDEGGIDQTNRKYRSELELVPWSNLPEDIQRFPAEAEPGRGLRTMYGQQFTTFFLSPGRPRGLMLRGQFSEASTLLVENRDQLLQERQRLRSDPETRQRVANWLEHAREAYAALYRAERSARGGAGTDVTGMRAGVKALWKEAEAPLTSLFVGAGADPLNGMTTYFLALCKHEQAERAQAQLDRSGTAGSAEAIAGARDAWRSVADWWETFLAEYPGTQGSPNARRLLARALEALQRRDAALAMLQDLSGEPNNLEATGRLYLAEQLKKKPPVQR
jgi:hypothetical protein